MRTKEISEICINTENEIENVRYIAKHWEEKAITLQTKMADFQRTFSVEAANIKLNLEKMEIIAGNNAI